MGRLSCGIWSVHTCTHTHMRTHTHTHAHIRAHAFVYMYSKEDGHHAILIQTTAVPSSQLLTRISLLSTLLGGRGRGELCPWEWYDEEQLLYSHESGREVSVCQWCAVLC